MIAIGLLHYPVYNKRNEIVQTAIVSLDVHDLARLAKTYNLDCFYVIHPIASQQNLVRRMLRHWREGYGATYNPQRKIALKLVKVLPSYQDVIMDLSKNGLPTVTIVTSAHSYKPFIEYKVLRMRIKERKNFENYLLIFGTGWGIEYQFCRCANLRLKPIEVNSGYNHLSVRSAASIIIDRLFG